MIVLFQLLILFQEGLCNSNQQCHMCDSVSHVLGHVFVRQSHLTTSIVEWAVDFCEGTFNFHVVFYLYELAVVSTAVLTGSLPRYCPVSC